MTPPTDPFDAMCPMHVRLSPEGRVRHAGPTLAKLFGGRPVKDALFFELFEVVRPVDTDTMAALARLGAQKLQLRLCDPPHTVLKAIAIPDPAAPGFLINMSFGISVRTAVRDFALTNTDFAPTDLTIEMLYLMEAKSVAMEASRHLNQRLDLARTTAETQALTDALTGLYNRRGLDRVLARAVTRGAWFALMHVDLDHFKQINDTLGHAAGDQVLQEAARIMQQETRHRDTIARVGGDEFVLVIDDPPGVATVNQIAERLINRFETPVLVGEEACKLSCSIGTVFSADYADGSIERMFRDADEALYASKNKGRGCHTIFSAFATQADGSGVSRTA